jgi:ArsR family transcriptional regulator, arsenate/arsenite/antimonite-responsive transcriptional repressor
MNEIFKALGDPTRLRIIQMLAQTGDVCVCSIMDDLGMGQSAVSHHMSKLKHANLVHTRREGQWIHYSLNVKVVEAGPLKFLQEIVTAAGPETIKAQG